MSEFVRDLELIDSNCREYNGVKSPMAAASQQMLDYFQVWRRKINKEIGILTFFSLDFKEHYAAELAEFDDTPARPAKKTRNK